MYRKKNRNTKPVLQVFDKPIQSFLFRQNEKADSLVYLHTGTHAWVEF